MGIATIAGTNIQYFSLSEEVIAISTLFFKFIINISGGWILFLTAITIGFIAYGVLMRLKNAGEVF